jgi:hypothetical protein
MISRRAERRKAADERIPSAAEFNVTGLALLIAVALFARDNSAVWRSLWTEKETVMN